MPPGYEWGGYRHEPTRQQSSLYHDAHAAQRHHEQQQQAAAAALANKRALSRDLMQTARVNADLHPARPRGSLPTAAADDVPPCD